MNALRGTCRTCGRDGPLARPQAKGRESTVSLWCAPTDRYGVPILARDDEPAEDSS
jgi:hypothetical protein